MNTSQIQKHGYKLSILLINQIDEYCKNHKCAYEASVCIGTQSILEACCRIVADALSDLPYNEATDKLTEFLGMHSKDIENQTKAILSQQAGARILDFKYYQERLKEA